jgi:hypothetical protein
MIAILQILSLNRDPQTEDFPLLLIEGGMLGGNGKLVKPV